MKSLLITSLPKSLSTVTYRNCLKALPLEAVAGVARHGEAISLIDDCLKKVHGPDRGNELQEVVNHMLQFKDGFVVKDVLAPFLPFHLNQDFNILHCVRPAADVVYLRLTRSHFAWELRLLPQPLAIDFENVGYEMVLNADAQFIEYHLEELVDAVLWGQKLAARGAHSNVPYDALIRSPNALYDALEAMGYKPSRHAYINSDFKKQASKKLAIRDTAKWKEIQDLVEVRRPIVDAVAKRCLL